MYILIFWQAIISLTAGSNYTLNIINPNVSQRCDGLSGVKLNLTINTTVDRDYYFCNLSISLFYLRVIKLVTYCNACKSHLLQEQLTDPLADCPVNQVRDCSGNCASVSFRGWDRVLLFLILPEMVIVTMDHLDPTSIVPLLDTTMVIAFYHLKTAIMMR